jgi:hypothetical protein
MKSNELRIGNIYQSVKWNIPVILCISDLGQLDIDRESAELDEKLIGRMFAPIILTEEWLLKFGFEKTRDYNLSTKPKMYKIFKLSLRLMANEYTFCYENSFRKIEYVHQLQNLYFTLTGEELTISKTK